MNSISGRSNKVPVGGSFRQLATAEASYPEPDYAGLKAYIMGEFEKAIDEEIANGIARQKGQAQKPVYPGAAR